MLNEVRGKLFNRLHAASHNYPAWLKMCDKPAGINVSKELAAAGKGGDR